MSYYLMSVEAINKEKWVNLNTCYFCEGKHFHSCTGYECSAAVKKASEYYDKKTMKRQSVLVQIYGFDDQKIRRANNGSWDIEQYIDNDLIYTARLLKTGEVYVTVETNDKYPKLIEEYKV